MFYKHVLFSKHNILYLVFLFLEVSRDKKNLKINFDFVRYFMKRSFVFLYKLTV